MGKLVLVRHGESEGNVTRIFTTTPITLPLTELGRRQARAAADLVQSISNPRIVIASPYVRARDTGAIIAEALGLPFEIRAGLHERETGEFAGKPYESIFEAEGYDHARPWTWIPPGGESYEHVRDRVGPILDELAARFPDDDVVVVSHGGVMVSMWAYMTGRWDDAHVPPNCGIVLVEHRAGKFLKPQVIGSQESQRHAGG
ncbi:MAG TPA: histidine phosphatase family protein [Candidatus Binataceae bacterium]|nr:histidine phosphatase family protein [Candidatus Binataceae bacterium]